MKGGRKWVLISIILIIVAIILTIVFINLFKERETTQLAENVNTVIETGYLAEDSEEYEEIESYLDYLLANFSSEEEKTEVLNYKNSYNSFIIAGDFFNRQIAFTKYSKAYKNNWKAVKNEFSRAQSSADSFKQFITEKRELAGGSTFWNVNTWVLGRDYMKTIFKNTKSALNRLSLIYTDGVNSQLLNNDFTVVIFKGYNHLAGETANLLKEDSQAGSYLLNFTQVYMSKANDERILGYIYDEALQTKIETLKSEWDKSVLYTQFLRGTI